jgi:TrmH family RNA methyltransferase
VADALLQRCSESLRIPQPGGEESLNVAAAAAVCLYESARQRAMAR